MRVVRVVVVDRRPLVREVLAGLLGAHPEIEVAAAGRIEETATQTGGPDLDGVDVIVSGPVGQRPDPTPTRSVVRFTDADSIAEITDAVLGRRAVSRTRTAGPPRSPASLTARESHVLAGVADGLRSTEIAGFLGITPKSVENHKQRIYTKLGVQSQAQAVAVALDAGPLPRVSDIRSDRSR